MNKILRTVFTALLFILILALFAPVTFASSPDTPPVLKQGMSGDEVYKLQLKLQEFGFYQAGPDGKFGTQTKIAVTNFQLECGLEPDGVAGPATLQAMKDFKPSAQPVSRAAANERKGAQVAAFSKQFLGVPYVWAGRSPSGFDCSGFIYYIYSQFGYQLPRMADEQYLVGMTVSRRDLLPGDLVFFSTYEPGPSHVGIYIGGGQFIHASSGATEVTITPLSKAYYQSRYLGARRIIR